MSIFSLLNKNITERVEYFGAQYIMFGIFGVLNYPIYYMIWNYGSKQSYESLLLRATATILCLILVLKNYWPSKAKEWLPVYWYITLTFCIPFFFTYMLLRNDGAEVWLMSTSTIFFWLVLLVDWGSYVALLILGIALALIAYFFTADHSFVRRDYGGIISQYAGAIIVVTIFAHNKELIQKEKVTAISAAGYSIAHELRTPLAAISGFVSSLKNFFPTLLATYQKAVNAHIEDSHISKSDCHLMERSLDKMQSEINYSNVFIDMLLMNSSNAADFHTFEVCSLAQCVNEALRRYPFTKQQRELVHVNIQNDFTFQGKEILLVHVLFNLIKNALYYIKAAGKGNIQIWTEEDKNYNKLCFKDGGKGIPAAILSKMFTRFFTTERNGTGLGLAFCKMVMETFGGKIACSSVEGEFTLFVMFFPKIKS